MHRSGTSFCVRALERHGVGLPPNLLLPAADNPEGFQESADLIALNEAWLTNHGCQWDGSWPLTIAPEPDAGLRAGLALETRRLLHTWCTAATMSPGATARPAIALKDPRLCRTLPQLSAALGTDWLKHGLAIVRDPAAVIGSIGYRDDMPPLKALALWLRYNLDLVQCRQLDGAVGHWPLLRFERLLEDPVRELRPALQHFQASGLLIQPTPNRPLQCRTSPQPPSSLEGVPDAWLSLARRFHAALGAAPCLAAVPDAVLEEVGDLLDRTPSLSQKLLALEARRRDQLGRLLAEERRGPDAATGLRGADDQQICEQDHGSALGTEQAYVRLDQVCIDLRGRGPRRSIKQLLRPQGPSGLRPLALDHLDLLIGHGERIGLLGHNGSGKTTLLRLLGGIYSPTAGQIERDGPPLAPVIEQSLGFSQELTGLQLARFSHRLYRAASQSWSDYRAAIEAFTELGDALATPIKTWSLGMRTRLSFALITFRDVQGLALDEGLAAGDQWFQRKARSHLDRFIEAAGTLVLASHSEDLLRRYCTRGLILERGRLVYDGSLFRALQLYKGQLN